MRSRYPPGNTGQSSTVLPKQQPVSFYTCKALGICTNSMSNAVASYEISQLILWMQLLQAKRQARQQAFFNFVTLCLVFGSLAGVSTWAPHFRYLGRIWQVMPVGNKVQAYTELASEGFAWALLLTMGWPWNLLIYPVHLTRKELTSARKDHRSAISVTALVCYTCQLLYVPSTLLHYRCKMLTVFSVVNNLLSFTRQCLHTILRHHIKL